MRGTDKSFGGDRVPPQFYIPYIERYLKQHPDAIMYVATDTTSWLEVLRSKYGAKVVSLDGSLRSGQ
jgi:hypothetical protein